MPSSGVLLFVLAACAAVAAAAKPPADLPEEEKAIADTVDPWGLPFSDQLSRFQARFEDRPEAGFCVGYTHNLVKIWPNKYWFRGPSFVPGQENPSAPVVKAVEKQTEAFQIAILPRVGAAEATYTVKVTSTPRGMVGVKVYREVFVSTPKPAYPRFETDRWPDPLIPDGREVTLSGLDAGVFWIDAIVPSEMPTAQVAVHVEVTDGKQTCEFDVPFEAVHIKDLYRITEYPFVGWFRDTWSPEKKELTPEQFKGMCRLVLGHGLQPIDALTKYWDPKNPEDFTRFDEMMKSLRGYGQRIFALPRPGGEGFQHLYDHVKADKWLRDCVLYSNRDEPDPETFRNENIPDCQEIHEKYPGLRVYLASEYHPDMEQGCDMWMTDISSLQYDPEGMRAIEAPELWHYYCHLPVRWQCRAPLVFAPNMQIDNPALEHRLALWMSRYYGAKGVFIWAGFSAGGFPADFWETLTLSDKPSGFPYAGIHNGNNFRVYPPREEGGDVLPSIRLKVTRDALQDIALFEAVERLIAERGGDERAKRLRELLDPTPEVFVHTHYWDHLPETLLGRRQAILQALDEQ